MLLDTDIPAVFSGEVLKMLVITGDDRAMDGDGLMTMIDDVLFLYIFVSSCHCFFLCNMDG